jgi:DtxR family Mn-dependent transcriptional regulator
VDIWKRFGEKEVTHSMAHYLQAVASLKDEKGHAKVVDIAERLGVSKSGVTSMMRSLAQRGYVTHERYGAVELSEAGRRLAERTESNRRVLSVFLTEILAVPEEVANEDACMIEHLVSPEVMLELLRLTSFMRSEHPSAHMFREAFKASPGACAHHPPGACDLCGPACLRDTLMPEAGSVLQRIESGGDGA